MRFEYSVKYYKIDIISYLLAIEDKENEKFFELGIYLPIFNFSFICCQE